MARSQNGSAPKPTSKRQWAAAAVHTIQLHSGAWVKIRIPDLSLLLAADQIPDDLRDAAVAELVQEQAGATAIALRQTASLGDMLREEIEKLTDKTIAQAVHLNEWLVTQMVVEPELTEDDIKVGSQYRPPNEDMALLVAIARRERNTDARGVPLGVARLDQFERFREFHECSADCAACAAWMDELSTVDVGAV